MIWAPGRILWPELNFRPTLSFYHWLRRLKSLWFPAIPGLIQLLFQSSLHQIWPLSTQIWLLNASKCPRWPTLTAPKLESHASRPSRGSAKNIPSRPSAWREQLSSLRLWDSRSPHLQQSFAQTVLWTCCADMTKCFKTCVANKMTNRSRAPSFRTLQRRDSHRSRWRLTRLTSGKIVKNLARSAQSKMQLCTLIYYLHNYSLRTDIWKSLIAAGKAAFKIYNATRNPLKSRNSMKRLRNQRLSKNRISSGGPSPRWTQWQCARTGALDAWSAQRPSPSSRTSRTISERILAPNLSHAKYAAKNSHNEEIVIDTREEVFVAVRKRQALHKIETFFIREMAFISFEITGFGSAGPRRGDPIW